MSEQISWLDPEDKVRKSIGRLKMFEPEDGYYLAFSGGKDSICIKQIAIEAGVKFDAHYNLTTVDPPELVQYIKQVHPDVEINRPERTMWELIVYEKAPPTRIARYCCGELKERSGEGRYVITGVRWAESARRANNRGVVETNFGNKNRKDSLKLNNDNDEARRMVETCVMKSKHVVNPIIDWTDEDVWWFIKSRNLEYCILYDEGFARLGCIGCPQGNERQMKSQFARWPMYYRSYIRAFDKMVAKRIELGLDTTWANGQEVMDWWISNIRHEKPIEGQEEMEFDDGE